MGTSHVVAVGAAGISAMVAVAAHGRMDTSASSNGPKTKAVVDASGNLHVPDAYRASYQFLGSWAVAADDGQGSGHGSMLQTLPRQRRLTTKRIVDPVMCRRKLPIGSMSVVTRRLSDRSDVKVCPREQQSESDRVTRCLS